MASDSRPLVSVAIPLFRSKPFLNYVIENIEAIESADVEIIVSDRHGTDDALDLLRRRFGVVFH